MKKSFLKQLELPEKKTVNLLIFYLLFILLSFLSFLSKGDLNIYNYFVLLPVVVFLLYLNKDNLKKVALEGVIFGIMAEVGVDFFGHMGKGWFSPTAFNFRIFGLLPIENFVWCILYALLIIGFYEYFFDKSRSHKIPHIHKYWLIAVSLICIIFPVIFLDDPSFFAIRHFYFYFVLLLIVVEVFLWVFFRKITSRAMLASLLLFPLGFIHEFVSLEYHHWIFEKGNHILYVPIFSYSIPMEEITFYFLAPVVIIALYEIFADNRK